MERGLAFSMASQNSGAKKPLILLGIGNARIEEWIKVFFLEQANIKVSPASCGELRESIDQHCPDILVIMRHNSMGGVPDAGNLAVSAVLQVPAVLFIVGELDDEGREMFDRAREAGVKNIITCEKGGQIYGDELVYSLTGLIREINSPAGGEEKEDSPRDGIPGGEARKAFNALFQGAGSIGRAIIKSAETVSEKARTKSTPGRALPRINKKEGVSLKDTGGHGINLTPMQPTAIIPGGALAIATPWRPSLAGRLAAQAAKLFGEAGEATYIGASGNSTGALWLDVPEDELSMSDWRVPGSNFPITRGNIKIFAVDPVKDLQPENEEELWMLLQQARRTSAYTVVDFAGDLSMARKAALQGRAVLLVVVPGNDPVELRISTHWIKNIMEDSRNVVTGIDIRGVLPQMPEDFDPRVIVRNNPADALHTVLKKQNDNVFVWV
jgi:hypothetical protein